VFFVWRYRANPRELKAPTGYPGNRDIPNGVRKRVKSSSAIWMDRRHAHPQRRDSLATVAEHRDRALVGLTGQGLEISAGTPMMVRRRGSGWAVA
jgi:hypothetical protein